MRRALVPLLRCPACRHGVLTPEVEGEELTFGPLHCEACHARFSVSEGVADLVGNRPSRAWVQRGLEQPAVARAWERTLRPALRRAAAPRTFDLDSEATAYRALLGAPAAPVLDLACGTGLLARRLARDPQVPSVVGLDVSRAMLQEAVAQAREAGVRVDFVRAEAPALPFRDGSLGGVLQAGSLHLMADLGALLAEVARVLAPGARYVAGTLLPRGRLGRALQARVGVYARDEGELRAAAEAAGLAGFERLRLEPLLLFKVEKPRA